MSRSLVVAQVMIAIGGCGRLDYSAQDGGSQARDATFDAPVIDASMRDASSSDASSFDASSSDASDEDASSDAGSDAGLGDAGSDAGPVMRCPFDAIFCDGYEDPALAAWTYAVISNGTAERTTTRSRTGAASLVCSAAGDLPKEARYTTTAPGGWTSGDLWVRAFYYLPSSVVLNVHVSVLALTERVAPYDGTHVLVDADSVDLEDGINDIRTPGDRALPRDAWVCVELHSHVDDTAGALELFVDGAMAASASGIDTLPVRGLEVAEIGVHYAVGAQLPVELFVDDVVIASTRIGCE